VHDALPHHIRTRGSIRIDELYNEGVYETGVQGRLLLLMPRWSICCKHM
jgi:hypothetical protein